MARLGNYAELLETKQQLSQLLLEKMGTQRVKCDQSFRIYRKRKRHGAAPFRLLIQNVQTMSGSGQWKITGKDSQNNERITKTQRRKKSKRDAKKQKTENRKIVKRQIRRLTQRKKKRKHSLHYKTSRLQRAKTMAKKMTNKVKRII